MMSQLNIPDQTRDELLNTPNVVGVGRGEKITNNQVISDSAVVVFVREKVDEQTLIEQYDEDAVVPTTVTIDGKEIQTDVQEVGDVRALLAQGGMEPPGEREYDRRPEPREAVEPESIPDEFDLAARRKKWRPAPAGVSVGHPNVTAGTLGTPPLRTINGKTVFLTNTHVAAPVDRSSVGDSIYQPGPADGGTGTDQIGTLLEKTDIAPKSSGEINRTDSALVEIEPDHLQLDIFEVWADLKGWTEPQVGQYYEKSGRTTGVTSGRLRARDATLQIGGFFPDEPAVFEGLDVFDPISAGGDSGSLIGTDRGDGFYGASLLFAGSSQITLGIPMSAVQSHHGQLTPVQDSRSRVRPDDLRITGTQWQAAIDPGETQRWFTFNWPAEYLVDWHVEPTTPGGRVSWSVEIERTTNGHKTYWITVRNVGDRRTEFEGKYALFR